MDAKKYQTRREALVQKYQRTLFVIPSGHKATRSHSVNYRFKVHSDFYYLTGFDVDGAVLILSNQKSYLLWPQRDALHQVWDGDDADPSAQQKGELELARPQQLNEILGAHLAQVDRLATSVGMSSEVQEAIWPLLSYGRSHRGRKMGSPLSFCDSRPLIGWLRHRKDAGEIQDMQEAAMRSSKVHRALMQENWIGFSEKEVSNWIESQFLKEGLQWPAYETIVGSGDRSVVLHARASEKIIQKDEMLLIDAGGEWKGYCADITRTFPVGAKFSKEQALVYKAVQKAQEAVIKSLAVGRTLIDLHQEALTRMLEELQQAGFSKLDMTAMKELMPHNTSHWIGMDVHDPSPYLDEGGEPVKLEAGMSLTIEPGLYFRDSKFGSAFQGIGVRIEDDIVVTDAGADVLTSVPKTIEEIESLRAKA